MDFKAKRRIVKFKYLAVEAIQIIIGTAIIAFGTTLFLLPNQLSAGGFSGLGTITYYLFGIPLGTTTLILNAPLLSTFLNIFETFEPLTTDRFLGCIYGGIIAGIGTAIILRANASTGRNRSFNTNNKVF